MFALFASNLNKSAIVDEICFLISMIMQRLRNHCLSLLHHKLLNISVSSHPDLHWILRTSTSTKLRTLINWNNSISHCIWCTWVRGYQTANIPPLSKTNECVCGVNYKRQPFFLSASTRIYCRWRCTTRRESPSSTLQKGPATTCTTTHSATFCWSVDSAIWPGERWSSGMSRRRRKSYRLVQILCSLQCFSASHTTASSSIYKVHPLI